MEPFDKKEQKEQLVDATGFIFFDFRSDTKPDITDLAKLVRKVDAENPWTTQHGSFPWNKHNYIHSAAVSGLDYKSDIVQPEPHCRQYIIELHKKQIRYQQCYAYSRYLSCLAEKLAGKNIRDIETVSSSLTIEGWKDEFQTPEEESRLKLREEAEAHHNRHLEHCHEIGGGCTYDVDAFGVYWRYCKEGKRLSEIYCSV